MASGDRELTDTEWDCPVHGRVKLCRYARTDWTYPDEPYQYFLLTCSVCEVIREMLDPSDAGITWYWVQSPNPRTGGVHWLKIVEPSDGQRQQDTY